MTNKWTEDSIESQKGKTVIITGGSSGIGLEAAKVLSSKGANVIIAVLLGIVFFIFNHK